ncbi:hypothetical protein CISG_04494 [Coccidioides immitis RMSCC 3703]|uniref:Uncharacterized protein n=1 Tax=Coccidioides immitis RMSCC 3703 TaxID=454286 RepID=A0A0J8QT17_COCIT|nr:hypothetical protein CISG_04494 [Coccidioides immitis RMSCC 3703]
MVTSPFTRAYKSTSTSRSSSILTFKLLSRVFFGCGRSLCVTLGSRLVVGRFERAVDLRHMHMVQVAVVEQEPVGELAARKHCDWAAAGVEVERHRVLPRIAPHGSQALIRGGLTGWTFFAVSSACLT